VDFKSLNTAGTESVTYLKSKTLTRKQYVIFVMPVTTGTDLPTEKGYLTSFKWNNLKLSTNRQITHGLTALSAAQAYITE
jgi:hypothetical protein